MVSIEHDQLLNKRKDLVNDLCKNRVIYSKKVKNAFLKVKREKFIDNNFDSLLTLSPMHPLTWKLDEDIALPQYDYMNRPMKQDFKDDELIYDENGSVYVFTIKSFNICSAAS